MSFRLISIVAEKLSFEEKYASFKKIKFPMCNYQTDSSEKKTVLFNYKSWAQSYSKQFSNLLGRASVS